MLTFKRFALWMVAVLAFILLETCAISVQAKRADGSRVYTVAK
jgi:hypothetical protein